MDRRVLIYALMGAYICMDGCLYMHGRMLILHGRVLILHSGPDSFADGLPLHISNGNRINAIKSAPTVPSCTRIGIVYTLSFTSASLMWPDPIS